MNLKEVKFQYYRANIESKRPIGELSLYDYLYAIKHPKPEIVEIFKQIEKASKEGDKKLKTELKSKLFYFSPCIRTDWQGRSYENIKEWTGLMIIDADNLEVEYARELKQHLFDTYSFITASFLSASKKGVKALVRIPICYSVEEFKSYYAGLMGEFQHYKGIDPSAKNCVLPNYLTYDRELLYRLDATVWDKKGVEVDEFKVYEGEIVPLENVSEYEVNECKTILRYMFNKIVDTGHIIVRSASLLAGGYVASGYMSYDEMRDYLFELIEDTPYLHKSINTYKKTCLQMLEKGMLSPVKLNYKD